MSGAAEPGADEVLVKLEAAPISPADLSFVRGVLRGQAAPRVAGNEGVGTVVRGPGFKAGDRVLVAGVGAGTWASEGVFAKRNVYALLKTTAPETGAALGSVCAAVALLGEHGSQLKSGDVLIHVGGAGAVAMALTQLVPKGVKIVHIMANEPGVDDAVAQLKEHGAFAAVTADYARTAAFRRLLSDVAAPSLVLNGLGGDAATEALRMLAPGGRMVTYAGRPFSIPSSLLIDRGVELHGFSLERKMTQELVSKAEKANVKLMIEKHQLSNFSAALQRHEEPGRSRKVILMT